MSGTGSVGAGAQPDVRGTALSSAFDAQRSAFKKNPPTYADRLDALTRLEHALRNRREEIVAAVSQDFGGRAAEETLALELLPLLNEIRHARRHLKRWMAPRRARVEWQCWPASARILRHPLGVVGILSPWNYPLFLSLGPMIGAVAAGNHVLLKPSEIAPATADLLASILSGLFAPTYVAAITGGPETATEFVGLPFDHILFTGSTRVGRLVMKAASENLVPVTLELGGKSPALLHPAYTIEKGARRIMTGKLYNAGQTCVAPDYVLLPRGRLDEFVTAARRAASSMYPALVDNPDYTRIINAHHYRRLEGLVEDARARGAEIIQVTTEGETYDGTNRVFPPTMVTKVRDDMAIMREEIFGPVLPIVDYGSLDEAIAYVNARPHPLALYYFDDDRRRANYVLERTAAGGATVNDCVFHVGQSALPFGGRGPSGMGRYHGFDGFETFSHKQGVLFQRRWSALSLLRPPYAASAKKVLNALLRM